MSSAQPHLAPQRRRAALRALDRDRIKELTDHFGLEVADRSAADNHVEAIVTTPAVGVLRLLKREERQAICDALGQAQGERLGLGEDELAFYEALGANYAAVKVLGDATLKAITRELTDTICGNVSIDWTQRVTAQAKLRTMVRRLLGKYGYPPDKQEQATQTVMEQAERLCATWAEDGTLGAQTQRRNVHTVPKRILA